MAHFAMLLMFFVSFVVAWGNRLQISKIGGHRRMQYTFYVSQSFSTYDAEYVLRFSSVGCRISYFLRSFLFKLLSVGCSIHSYVLQSHSKLKP